MSPTLPPWSQSQLSLGLAIYGFPLNALTLLNWMGSSGPSQPPQVLTAAGGTIQPSHHTTSNTEGAGADFELAPSPSL